MLVRYCTTRVTARAAHGGADDIAQDICVAIVRGLPRFTGDPRTLMPWVYGIAAHKVMDYYNRTARDRSDPSDDLPSRQDPHPGPEELVLRGEERAIVRSWLARLRPAQRQVLALRVSIGLSTTEICAATGLSATAVRATQRRAMLRLRRYLER